MPRTRYDHYKVPEIELFMMNIMEKKDKVEPVFDLEFGYRYRDVEQAIKMDATKTVEFLENLHGLEILDREKYDMEFRCSKCNSPNVSTNYLCPHCSSSVIQRTLLLEHFKCGYLGTATSFGEPMICPKCQARIAEGDYRDAGSVFECASCKRQIETPFVVHWCRGCGHRFSLENAVYEPVYAYSPAELTRKEIKSGILYLSTVQKVFEDLGLTRDGASKVIGESGTEHAFDLAFSGLGAKFFVDVFFSLDRMGEMEVLREYAKVKDVKADVYVIVLPGLDDAASALAKAYGMGVLEARKPEEALSKLRMVLTERTDALKALQLGAEVPVVEKPKRRSLLKRGSAKSES